MKNRLSQRARLWNLLWVVGAFFLLFLPIVIFLIFSFNNAPFPSPWRGWTLRWYRELFSSTEIWHALTNSLIISFSAVFLSVIMGVFLVFLAMQGGRIRFILSHFYANLVLPEIVLAVGLLALFTALGMPLGMPTLIIAHTVLGLGYVVPLVHARYEELDYRLTEAALDLGATPLRVFSTVTLPLLQPTLMASAIMVFIVSFDDFVFAYFCSGSSFQTLPIYILSMLRTGVSPVVNALSTVLLIFCSLLIVVYSSFKTKIRMF
ncbi:TPA: spermidine/putrescine ABC transporter permease [Candidatus Dependentiae bacterium]|nr:MAG: Putrescine transport system permease protein potI [candidate division TM6 bacterium GW2011_GWF2_43_87]HBL98553.1 spermidine/putrescine ABC transporter permease [Candidatus Dependentiae bacterium]